MSLWKMITVTSFFSVMRLPDQSNLKETAYWATIKLQPISVGQSGGRDGRATVRLQPISVGQPGSGDGKQPFIPSQEQRTMS